MCDHVDKQDNLEVPQSRQLPVVINAIITPGRTRDGDDGDVVWIRCPIIWGKIVIQERNIDAIASDSRHEHPH